MDFYGNKHYQQVVRDISKVFGTQKTTTRLAQHMTGKVNQTFSIMERGQFQKPQSSDIHWPLVREYLVDHLQLPAPLVDKFHEDGLIYSERLKNCIFSFDQNIGQGVFR